jgi:hypothetical protein
MRGLAGVLHSNRARNCRTALQKGPNRALPEMTTDWVNSHRSFEVLCLEGQSTSCVVDFNVRALIQLAATLVRKCEALEQVRLLHRVSAHWRLRRGI